MNKLAVIDFGGQYSHLIANRVRRLGVFCEVLPPHASMDDLKEFVGIIFSGGPSSVYDANIPEFNPDLLNCKVPLLGICYGHQLICKYLGGEVKKSPSREYGPAELTPDVSHPLFAGVNAQTTMWMSHGDEVIKIPEGFSIIGATSHCSHAAIGNDQSKKYGIQFHPEVTHSIEGLKVLENFLDICKAPRDWDMTSYYEVLKERTLSQCKGKKVFLLVSGGVDSTVAFALLNKILGPENVKGLHIDNGLMRKNESKLILEFMATEGFHNLEFCDASETFLNKLKGVVEPEAKREIIGDTFLDVLDEQVKHLDLNPKEWIMAQGTTYPDTIESGGTKDSATIKTHHNRVPKAVEMLEKGLIIEPLAELYKDEVRALGTQLGIPDELVWRHPFPGPGLGVRLLCSNGDSQDLKLESATAKIRSILSPKNLTGEILPISSVGVQGDARTYAHPCLITGVTNWEQIKNISTTLTGEISEINRVVIEVGVSSKGTTQGVPLECNAEALDFLREADAICTEALFKNNLYKDIWQMPVVLLPLKVDDKYVVVMRPIHSSEAMTANYAEIDFNILADVWDKLSKIGAGALYYDITHKPPGTIEWE